MPIPSNSIIIYDTGQITDGVIATADIADAAVTVGKIAAGNDGDVLTTSGTTPAWAAPSSLPVGTVLPYAGATAPSGYLLADGSAVSRTTYSVLFALISTTFGVGDGSSTFNLPDLRGNVPVGKDTGTFNALGATGGEETHTLTTTEMPAHTHTQPWITGGSGTSGIMGGGKDTPGSVIGGNPATGSAGSDGAHNNLQPYLVLNYIVKY